MSPEQEAAFRMQQMKMQEQMTQQMAGQMSNAYKWAV
jgi:hypothetical protein